MLKTLMISAAASALMVSGAMAQTSPPAPAPRMEAPRADTAPVMKDAKFVSSQSADQFVFTKFKGTDVLGPDNAHIGDVDDVLFDKNGKVHALIVGVGGFLGIGEKNVAIDMGAFQVVHDTGDTAGGTRTTTGTRDPGNVKLKVAWTKDQLKAAPAFEYYREPARTTTSPGTSPTTGAAPRPQSPAPAPAPRQ